MNKAVLILDIDGVLITTPAWKADEMDSDGYSKFNEMCVSNLNKLLLAFDFEIWLSSTRRTVKSIKDFNKIFANRNIEKHIHGFLPEYENCRNRKEEILQFLMEKEFSNYLIIDDDKSLHGLNEDNKNRLIITDLMRGFNDEKLIEAIDKMKKEHNNV